MKSPRTQKRINEKLGCRIEEHAKIDPHCTDQLLTLQTNPKDDDTAYAHDMVTKNEPYLILRLTSEEK